MLLIEQPSVDLSGELWVGVGGGKQTDDSLNIILHFYSLYIDKTIRCD
jgi:hypothetical protein